MVDVLSHALWSFIAFRKKAEKWDIKRAVFFGILPDLFSWTIYLFYLLINGFKVIGKPPLENVPEWVFTLYGITHSLIIFGFVVLILFIIKRKVPVYIFAWALHILIDIPTHSREILPTPFLWPISGWQFPGVSWGTPWLFALNWGLLIGILVYIALKRRK